MQRLFGVWAAWSACAASLIYGVFQILQVAGVMPEPWDRVLIFLPSLLLAPAFVVAMSALHVAAPPERKTFTLSALALAIMYAVLASIVYVTQLGVVIPKELQQVGPRPMALACCAQGEFMTALDLLGYTWMSLSTLFAGLATTGHVRRWMIANGVLAPFLIAQLAWPQLIVVGALWLITFPAAMAGLAIMLARHSMQIRRG